MSEQVKGLKAGIKAERTKRQVSELIIKHKECGLDQEECDRLCELIDIANWVPFPCGDPFSVKAGVRCDLLWKKVSHYCKENNCDGALVQSLIRDHLKPARLAGESRQKQMLQECADPIHHKAFWSFLKEYEAAYELSVDED